jgi:hypothetical protein
MRAGHDEVIDASMLETLALIAAQNDRSLVEELNRAVQAYVMEQMPIHSAAPYTGRIASQAGRESTRSP